MTFPSLNLQPFLPFPDVQSESSLQYIAEIKKESEHNTHFPNITTQFKKIVLEN